VAIRYSQVWKAQSKRNWRRFFVGPQERLLVHVVGVFDRPQQVHPQPQHTAVVSANQLLEGVPIAFLSRPDQRRFLHARCWSVVHGRCGFADHAKRLPEDKTVASPKGNAAPGRFRKWICAGGGLPHRPQIVEAGYPE